jgi:hypothetical protein
VASCIKTKHKALLIADSTNCKFSYKQPRPKVYRRCFDLREPYIQVLQKGLACYNWSPLLQEKNVQLLYDDLFKVFRCYINNCMPMKFVGMSQRCPKFITPLIYNLLRCRNRLLHKGKVVKAGELSVKVWI